MQGWSERVCHPAETMLIVSCRSFLAVLFWAACYFQRTSCQPGHSPSRPSRRSDNSSLEGSQEADELMSPEAGSRWSSSSYRDTQLFLLHDESKKGLPVDCCPSTLEMVEPMGGTNTNGTLVQLYTGGEKRQRFFELSCRPDVEGKPCRFLDRRLHHQSKCVQKYSYTYAIVRDVSSSGEQDPTTTDFPAFPSAGSGWMLDYIKIRSGCSCEVTPKNKRKRSRSKKGKNNKRNEHGISEEET